MKFSTKLALLFSTLLLSVVGGLGYIGYTTEADMLRNAIQEKLEYQAAQIMSNIEWVFYERKSDVTYFASDPVLSSRRSSPMEIASLLERIQAKYSMFSSLSFFDMTRTKIADTSGKGLGKRTPFLKFWPFVTAGSDFVMMIDDLNDRVTVVLFAALVKDEKGAPHGVLVSRLPLDGLFSGSERPIFGEFIPRMELLNSNGLILYSTYNRRGILKETSDVWKHIQAKVPEAGKTGTVQHSDLHEEVISAFAEELGHPDLKGSDWILVVSVPAKEVYGPLAAQRNKLLFLFSVTGFMSLLAVYLFSRGITKPLKALSRHAIEIGNGRLDTELVVSSNDEIGQLAAACGVMQTGLQQSEKKYKGLAEALPQIVFEIDEHGRFIFINDRACALTGYTREEFVSTLNAVLVFVPADRQRVLDNMQKILAGQEPSYNEYTALRKDKSTFPVLVYPAPFILDGRTKGIYGIAVDITERKCMEEEINALNAKLEQKVQERSKQLLDAQEELVRKEKLAILGQLAGSVGHELRNPLGVINNAVYYLTMVLPGADTKVKEYLDVIKSEVDASGRIVSDLLDLSRSREPNTTQLEPKQLIQESLGKCLVPENITVRTELAETLHQVAVDKLQMGQVFQNLIVNAVQAMPDGGTLHIRAEENREDRGVKITVSDTGAGISPENLPKLFQPLFTTKARGVGLGLTVSKRNTEANGGTLTVESRVGLGTTFTVLLPAKEGGAWKTP